MIAVLVSDENGVYFVGFDVSFLEHAANLFTAETRVDEHFAIFRDKESAIAGTATAEDGKLHGHCSGIMASELPRTQWRNREKRTLSCAGLVELGLLHFYSCFTGL